MARPKELGDRPSAAIREANRALSFGSDTMTLPICAPAMLKVLVVAVSITRRSATPSIPSSQNCEIAEAVWREVWREV